MTTKPSSRAAAKWITQGRAELHAQTTAQRGIQTPKETPGRPPKSTRERFTVNLPPELNEWARRAVVNTLGMTVSGLVERALIRELKRLEKERGEPFPATIEKPQRGRPARVRGIHVGKIEEIE